MFKLVIANGFELLQNPAVATVIEHFAGNRKQLLPVVPLADGVLDLLQLFDEALLFRRLVSRQLQHILELLYLQAVRMEGTASQSRRSLQFRGKSQGETGYLSGGSAVGLLRFIFADELFHPLRTKLQTAP